MSVGRRGHGIPWIFIHGTDIVNKGLIVLFFGLFLLFFGLFFVALLPRGRDLIVLFFGVFCYFLIFFSLPPSEIFLLMPLNRTSLLCYELFSLSLILLEI